MSLSAAPVGPVIPVSDLRRSRDFYEGRLGLRGGPVPGGHKLNAGGETVIYLLTDTDYPGVAEWPLASFAVADLDEAVRDLEARGVPTVRFSEGGQKTDARGIAEIDGLRIAWITDPDNQVISIFEA